MATTMRPPAATPRMAAPPLPSLQTSSTGLRTSTSPSLPSKRPPSIPRQLPNGGLHSASTSAHSGRPIRNRKESQRQTSARSMSRALTEGVESANAKNIVQIPYVRTDEYILRKFRDCPPSLIIHMHSTYFRFDQQDGTFPYSSPMRVIIDHIKAQTVPHDLLEELDQGQVRFYEGCLIVEVQDHKSSAATASHTIRDKSSLPSDKPYSVHKPSQYLTPSPYVPYPSPANTPDQGSPITTTTKEANRTGAVNAAPTGPKKFTVVLHPTALSKHREVLIEATTMMPEPRSHSKKSQAVAARDGATPSSAYPPTPISSVSNLPMNSKINSHKRRRMRLEEEDIHEFEAETLRNTETLLFLEPAESFEDCQAIIRSLTHPQHNHDPPKRAGRKRTFAELAADEAQAAEEERMALLGDTRLQPSLGITTAGQAAALDSGDAAKQTESNFRWAKNIEDITQEHREAKARKAQEEVQKKLDEAQRVKERQVEEEHEAQRERDRAKREQMEKARQVQMQMAAAQAQAHAQAQMVQAQAQQQAQASATPVTQTPNMQSGTLAHQQYIQKMMERQQQQLQASAQAQGQHASPMTNHAALNSSPMTGQPGHQQQGHGFQIQNNHAVNSPRPGSALQMHANMSQPMGRQVSQQQSHPSLSRTGTPQMPMATPQMTNSMPAHNMGTPQRQQHQGTPPMGGLLGAQANNMPQNVRDMNPLLQQQYLQMQAKRREQQQLQRQQQAAALAHMQNSPASNMPQMSPQQLAEFQARQARQQQANLPPNMMNGNANGMAQGQNRQMSEAEYRQKLSQQQTQMRQQLAQQQARQASMNGVSSSVGLPNTMAVASDMSRGVSQQNFPQQMNHQQPLTPGIQRNQQGQSQPAQNQPQGSPQNPNFPNNTAVSQSQARAQAQMQQMQNQKQAFLRMLANRNNGVVPADGEAQFRAYFEHRRMDQMQKVQAAQAAQAHAQQQQAMAMGRMPGQVPQQGQQHGQNPNQNQNIAQAQPQQGFGGGQMSPQQRQNYMQVGQGAQGPQGQLGNPEQLARVMRQKQMAHALLQQQQQQLGRGMGMGQMPQGVNGMGMMGQQRQQGQGRGNG